MKIEIPQNTTNGEVIQSMFPEAKCGSVGQDFKKFIGMPCKRPIYIYLDWWNAQYKAESEGK